MAKKRIAFRDPKLEAAVRAAAGRPEGELIPADAASVVSLGGNILISPFRNDRFADIASKKLAISDLFGIGHCEGLKSLNIRFEPGADADAFERAGEEISALDKLERLCISGAGARDIRMLSRLPHLKELYLENIKLSEPLDLDLFPDLETLHIKDCDIQIRSENVASGIKSLTLIRTPCDTSFIKNLSSVNCCRIVTDIFNTANFAELRELRSLNVSAKYIGDLAPALSCKKLEELHIYNCGADISQIASAKKLKRLFLCGGVSKDISALADLPFIEELYIDDNGISEISALNRISGLRVLSAAENRITDISPLSGLSELRALCLNRNAIRSVSPLSGLSRLETLELGYNRIESIVPLCALSLLSTLSLAGQKIPDIARIASLTSLKTLSLTGAALSDISFLSELVGLVSLELCRSGISDIKPLMNLHSLRYLDLSGNTVSKAQLEELSSISKELCIQFFP